MKLPISLGWKATNPIRLDQLPPLSGEYALHQHLAEGENTAHLKLQYGDTGYVLSLFIFDLHKFLRNEPVRVRSYDLWPGEIMFEAYVLKNGKKELHPRSGGKVYREDAVIIDEGQYEYKPPLLVLRSSSGKELKYIVKYLRTVRYRSPKYGYSMRTEYLFLPPEHAHSAV
ncbi:MAG: hypothetical protein GXO42_01670 [bacterium]|nr:hypothetical protein [bacterium]